MSALVFEPYLAGTKTRSLSERAKHNRSTQTHLLLQRVLPRAPLQQLRLQALLVSGQLLRLGVTPLPRSHRRNQLLLHHVLPRA